MTGDRRAIVVAGVCVLLLALLAGGGYVVWQRVQPDPGRLTLEVSGLPPGGSGNAVVEGPDGFRRSVTKTATLSVRPGAYTVRIKPARVGAATTYVAEEVVRTEVAASATVSVPVAYKILIPDTTRVLDPQASGLLSPASGLTLTFEASTPALAGLRVGEMIVVAEGPKTSELLVRKVVNVRRDGARLAVHTARARLEEAVPRRPVQPAAVFPHP